MVEVFKTDLRDKENATEIIAVLRNEFADCKVTVDLNDCDRVLRVQSRQNELDIDRILLILNERGFKAQPLPDELPVKMSMQGNDCLEYPVNPCG